MQPVATTDTVSGSVRVWWVVLGILIAVLSATSDLFAKRAARRGYDAIAIAYWRQVITVPLVLPLLLWTTVPEYTARFWWLHLIWVPLDATALFLYFYSVKHADLSLSVPLSGSAMIVTLIGGSLWLDEHVTPVAGLGLLLVLVGSYLLNLRPRQTGWFGPLRAVVTEPGVRAMLLASLLFGLNAVPFKLLIQESNNLYFTVHMVVVVAIALLPVGYRSLRKHSVRDAVVAIGPAAVCFGAMLLCIITALSMTYMVYVGSLKRLAGPISVLYGWLLFGESSIGMRILASVFIVGGGVLIALFG